MKKIKREKIVIPTYEVGEGEALPLFFEKRPYQGASGKVYPLPYTASISDEKKDKQYEGIVLENEYVRVVCLPEIGGKIHSALDKTNGYDFIYNNKVIKPAMVGLAGPWVAGGIEFNYPQHHRPTTYLPAEFSVGRDGVAYMGEFDYFHGMKGMIALALDEGTSRLRAKITLYNATNEEHPFMWWANMAVEVNDSYKIVFPPDTEYVNDHDRRAVLSWPEAKGIYRTARPFDYGDGTDIHAFDAVKVPSSFMIAKGQSDGAFVAGWDERRLAGVVALADKHIAPGKKLWSWGNGKFGAKWCSNLTDDGSKYVELMTGCYTDNQPDFTWIAPYETKEFEQIWYPVRDIGEVKCAAEEGACNLEAKQGGVFVGFYSVRRRNCVIVLEKDGKKVFEAKVAVSPERAFAQTINQTIDGLKLIIYGENGEEILSYIPPVRGNKKPIEPRLPACKPKELQTVEELYLNGLHLMQYKHFAYRAEDYFEEALARDPFDVRTNCAMGGLCLSRGQYKKAREYYDRAIERSTLRNANPYDTEPYYKRALVSFYEGDLCAAYEDAYAAVWSYPLRSAGYYLLAKIEALRGNKERAIEFLDKSLETNVKNLRAQYVRGLLAGDKNTEAEITKKDPLFLPDKTVRRAVDFAIELASFGLFEKAKNILEWADDSAMKFYYLAYLCKLSGDEEQKQAYIIRADGCKWEREFPSRRESITVLQAAGTPMADYYLGLICYHFERYAEACAAWERTVNKSDFAPAWRNLALGCFDHLGKRDEARKCLERAFTLMPDSDRIFYELTQLYKSLNLPLVERIALYEDNAALTKMRDDCTLDYSVLLTEAGETERAKQVLLSHRFHTYEGGEGYLTQHHAWLHYVTGSELLKAGKAEEADKTLREGLTFPENYGEEKNYFVNDAPLYYMIAQCRRVAGDESGEREALLLATDTKGAPTVHSYWQCLAYRQLGESEREKRLCAEMKQIGLTQIENADINDYYGVGAPAYPPFGYDVVRAHMLSGNLLYAFGVLAEGNKTEAERALAEVKKTDEADFAAFLLERLLYD